MRKLYWLTVFTLTLCGCGSKENSGSDARSTVQNGVMTLNAPQADKALAWLVTVTDATAGPAAGIDQVLCPPGSVVVRLPRGVWQVDCTGLLPPDAGRETAGCVRVRQRVDVNSGNYRKIGIEPFPVPTVSVADLPDYQGRLVRLKGAAGDGENPVLAALGEPINARGYPGRFAPRFADRSGSVIAPKVFAPISGFPPAFVENEVLAVYDEMDAPLYPQGPVWEGRTLFIYQFEPTGLMKLPAGAMRRVQKEWDTRTPLPAGKSEKLSTEYFHSVRYLRNNAKTGNSDLSTPAD